MVSKDVAPETARDASIEREGIDVEGDSELHDTASPDAEVDPPDTDGSSEIDVAPDQLADADDAPSCTADCPELGRFRCAADVEGGISRQVQVCSLVRGCLQWLDTAVCGQDEACCEGACRPLTCDQGTCAPPPAVDGGDSCSATFDVYVDASAAADGKCTRDSPCRTLTAGIAAALANPVGTRRILVAPGQYDAGLGETFPLNLRGGVTIVGSGNNTVIVGSGLVSHAQQGGDVNNDFFATVMMGDSDPQLANGLSNLQIRPDPAASGSAMYGIVCNSGNAHDDQIPSRPGATIAHVDLGAASPGGTTFDYAVLVTNSTIPTSSGCYLRMTGSTVHDAKGGVLLDGCAITGSSLPGVGAEIGGSALGAGNEFDNIKSDLNGWPIFARACARRVRIESNTFVNSDAGVLFIQAGADGAPSYATVIANRFESLGNFGFDVQGPLNVDEFRQNSFTNITSALTPATVDWSTPAVIFDSDLRMNVKARNNQFIGNDIGLHIRNYDALAKVSGNLDFGSTADPGNNTFRCNSRPGDPNILGADVVFEEANNAGPAVGLEGNFWDRSPPSSNPDGASPANGVEILLLNSHPPVTVRTSAVSDRSCPANRVP